MKHLNQLILFVALWLTSFASYADVLHVLTASDVFIENGTIKSYRGRYANIVIPAHIDGQKVVKVGNDAFRGKGLASVLMASSITEIGYFAFEGNFLTEVTLPNSVTNIGRHAFESNRLESVVIPNSVRFIGNEAFRNNLLTTISIPSSVSLIGGRAFGRNQLTEVDIPESVLFIGDSAFGGNEFETITLPTPNIDGQWSLGTSGATVSVSESYVYLVDEYEAQEQDFLFEDHTILDYYGPAGSIVIPPAIDGQAVEEIGKRAFRYSRLSAVSIPSSVTRISAEAFRYNDMAGIEIPNSVVFIGRLAFAGNEFSTMTLPIPDAAGEWNNGSAGSETNVNDEYIYEFEEATDAEFDIVAGEILAYYGSSRELVIPEMINGQRVTAIGYKAFSGKNLREVTIPESVTYIGEEAFSSNRLSDITLPTNLTFIGKRAFNSNRLASLTIPDGVTRIEDRAFALNSLRSLTLSASLTYIGEGAFLINQLSEISIPNSVIHLGAFAFFLNSLEELELSDGLKQINEYTFAFNQLSQVDIPEGVTRIEDFAFNLNSVSELTLPNGLQYIGQGAFEDGRLTHLTIPNSVRVIGANAFVRHAIDSLVLPDSLGYLGGEAFADNQLKGVDLPNSLLYIGVKAFNNNEFSSFELPSPTLPGRWTGGLVAGSEVPVDDIGDFYYTLTDAYEAIGSDFRFENGVILDYYGPKGSLIIPDSINNYPVQGIGDNAFEDKGLSGVVIPNTVTSIGTKAFNRNRLNRLVIPDGVIEIGSWAFASNALVSLTLSNTVVNIERGAFAENDLFRLEIPNSVKYIGQAAFGNNELRNVTLSNSVVFIDLAAFSGNDLNSGIVLLQPEADGVEFDGWIDTQGNTYASGEVIDYFGTAYSAVVKSHNKVLVSAKFEGEGVDLILRGSIDDRYTGVSELNLLVDKGSDLLFIPVAPFIPGQFYTPYFTRYRNIQESQYQLYEYQSIEDLLTGDDFSDQNIESTEIAQEPVLTHVYPNPSTTGVFYIDLPESASFKVYDAQQGVVAESQATSEGKTNVEITKGAGLYYLYVYMGDKVYTQRLQVR